MTQNKNQNMLYTQTQIIYMVMQCTNFFQQVDPNGQNQKILETSNILKECVLQVGLEYPEK